MIIEVEDIVRSAEWGESDKVVIRVGNARWKLTAGNCVQIRVNVDAYDITTNDDGQLVPGPRILHSKVQK